jgi:hypothetical protein
MTDAHTTSSNPRVGYEREFERTLVQGITLGIAHAPTCSDAAAIGVQHCRNRLGMLTALAATQWSAPAGASDRRRMLGSVMKKERRT